MVSASSGNLHYGGSHTFALERWASVPSAPRRPGRSSRPVSRGWKVPPAHLGDGWIVTPSPCEGVGAKRHANLRFPCSLRSRDGKVMRSEPPVSRAGCQGRSSVGHSTLTAGHSCPIYTTAPRGSGPAGRSVGSRGIVPPGRPSFTIVLRYKYVQSRLMSSASDSIFPLLVCRAEKQRRYFVEL